MGIETDWAEIKRRERQRVMVAAVTGATVFLFLEAWFVGVAPAALVVGAMVGGVAGLAWHYSAAGTFLSPAIAAPTYAGLQLLLAVLRLADPKDLTQSLIIGTMLVVPIAALIGTVRAQAADR